MFLHRLRPTTTSAFIFFERGADNLNFKGPRRNPDSNIVSETPCPQMFFLLQSHP
jgi:hypothetical protein